MTTDFITLGIRPDIQPILLANGISQPTPIQEQAIPAILRGRDIIGQAQTGTGKTLAFLLPLCSTIDAAKPHTQAVVLVPTRELALQIQAEAVLLAKPLGFRSVAVFGGHTLEQQRNQLKQGAQLVIGTPGRLLDQLRRKALHLHGVHTLILDEADQMLHMGFLDELEQVIQATPDKRQTLLFSATMPGKIRALANRYMRKPLDIRIPSPHVTLDAIQQTIIQLAEGDKLHKLCTLIDQHQPYLGLVFCHTKQRVSLIATALAHRGYNVDELHGDLSQAKRENVLRRFSEAKLQILVASDIAARGLDIEGITHVYNYDIPHDVETYIHRIGRTGRAGETGAAITFVTPEETEYLRQLERGIQASLEKYKVNGQKVVTKAKTTTKPDSQPTAPRPAWHKKKAKTRHSGNNQRSRRKPK